MTFRTTTAAILALLAAPAGAETFGVYMDGHMHRQETAAADPAAAPEEHSVFYQVSYPPDWAARGLKAPICNPCDHAQDGVTWLDHHDHVMTRPDVEVRQLFVVVPAHGGDARADEAVTVAYAASLPVRSAIDVNRLLAMRLHDGRPVAELIDADFAFHAHLLGH
ncbi:MAG: hypothetical protein AAF390_08860 [Pseudomonadota bacterium]